MTARGDNSLARPVQQRRPTADDILQVSDEDEDVLEDSRALGASGRTGRKKRRIDIEYTCPRCLQIFDDATNYIRHLRDSHQFSEAIEEKFVIRKCPHCVALRLKQKDYNKHIQEFHADLMSRCPVTSSTAATSPSTVPTSATQVSSNNVPAARPVTIYSRPQTTSNASNVSSANAVNTSTLISNRTN